MLGAGKNINSELLLCLNLLIQRHDDLLIRCLQSMSCLVIRLHTVKEELLMSQIFDRNIIGGILSTI